MNLVVSFLSMLETELENGGVKRMLGVCSEFERIAKLVLDKADKDSSSRRKRKNNDEQMGHPKSAPSQPTAPPQTPVVVPRGLDVQVPAVSGVYSPALVMRDGNSGFSPPPNNDSPNSNWNPDYNNSAEYMTPKAGISPYADMQAYPNGNDMTSPMSMNAFQQPFVPQDLWQMPMTLQWDWADMTGGAYPSFENGIVGDPNLQNVNNQHLQRNTGL